MGHMENIPKMTICASPNLRKLSLPHPGYQLVAVKGISVISHPFCSPKVLANNGTHQ